MVTHEQLTIIGAGCGGIEVAVSSRQNGWQGPIVVYDVDRDWPYHRPPLSKAYLKGTSTPLDMVLKTAETLEKAAIKLHLGTKVQSIDPQTRQIVLENGQHMEGYGKLVIATGGRARQLPNDRILAPHARNVLYLRTLQHANKLKRLAKPGARLVILGGGYIGLELAACATELGADVSVLEASGRLLQRVTSPMGSAFFRALHENNGVSIFTEAKVEGFECNAVTGDVDAVMLPGRTLACDLVVVGIGQLPNVELAEQAGLEVDDGIVVDEECRTSDPNIYALGDCARFPSSHYGRMMRLESVPNATEQARQIAASLCDKPRVAPAVPWFWSDQYDVQLKTAGVCTGYDKTVVRGSVDQKRFSIFYLLGSRLIAVDAVNSPADFMWSRKLIEKRAQVSEPELADESVPLKSLIQSILQSDGIV